MFGFSVDYDSTDINDILDNHKYLMKKDGIKRLEFLEKKF